MRSTCFVAFQLAFACFFGSPTTTDLVITSYFWTESTLRSSCHLINTSMTSRLSVSYSPRWRPKPETYEVTYTLGHKCCNTQSHFAHSSPSMLRSHSCLWFGWVGVQKEHGKSNIEARAEERTGTLVNRLHLISEVFQQGVKTICYRGSCTRDPINSRGTS